MFYSLLLLFFLFFLIFFNDLWSCLKQSIPSCIFLFSNKIYNLPRFENCLVFSVIMDPWVCIPCNNSHFVLRTDCSVFDRIFFFLVALNTYELFTILNLKYPLFIPQSTEEHQSMPLNVQISSDQICIVIKIKALNGIKGFYFEVHTMVLNTGLAL